MILVAGIAVRSLYSLAKDGRMSPSTADFDFFSDLILLAISCGMRTLYGFENVIGEAPLKVQTHTFHHHQLYLFSTFSSFEFGPM